jgi:hypothetical protein
LLYGTQAPILKVNLRGIISVRYPSAL